MHIYSLSLGSSGFGVEIKYEIVKDYCKENEVGHLEIYSLLKRIANEVHVKK